LQSEKVINHIVNWLKAYVDNSGTKGFVVGISGGIDSAVTSTLCAKTGLPVIAVNMPIYQNKTELSRADEHVSWLGLNFDNVTYQSVDLTESFKSIENTFPEDVKDFLTMANTRARLRMTTLFAFAGHHKMIVAGTGNKVEDFGVGFYTKYGDGGVDISPIADLMKTEVFTLAKELNIIQSIQSAAPTDGLFDDGRSDEDQIGATYPELEWAMEFKGDESSVTQRQKEVLTIFNRLNSANKHKMIPIPVCEIPKAFK
jgi:NAD+ synthase